MLSTLLIILLFGACDRFAGGPYVEKLGLPGRPVWYATVVMAGTMAGLGHVYADTWSWAWAALAWFVWREPKWKLFGGSLTPATLGQTVGFFLRHMLFIGFVGAAWAAGKGTAIAGAVVVAWAISAALLGVWLGAERDNGHDVNWAVEITRGLLQGMAVAMVLVWT